MNKIFKNKNFRMISIGVICGIALLLFGFSDSSTESAAKPLYTEPAYDTQELTTYTESLENKIAGFLSRIKGVSDVSVILTVESSKETVYATEGTNSDYVIIKDAEGTESALPITEITAKIRGIAVVCNYEENEKLKMTVIDTLASLFDLGANRISVISAR